MKYWLKIKRDKIWENKKKGFISLEIILVTLVLICLGVYGLNIFEKESGIAFVSATSNVKTILGTTYNYKDESNNENPTEEPNYGWIVINGEYYVGDIVIHNGIKYICTISHTTYGDENWAPGIAHSLWKRED